MPGSLALAQILERTPQQEENNLLDEQCLQVKNTCKDVKILLNGSVFAYLLTV
jgi:hypothetical protein